MPWPRPSRTLFSSPRYRSPDHLEDLAERLVDISADHKIRVWAMMETALAMLHAREIAAAARDVETRLSALVLGTNDLAKETRTRLVPGRGGDSGLADELRRRCARLPARHHRWGLRRYREC